MGTLSGIDDKLVEFIERQTVFFVATAPLASDGHINLSPKGLDTLRVLGPQQVAYLDLTGSGVETIAHLRENGRLVIMFCAFEGAPQILRLHGRGRVVETGQPEFETLIADFTPQVGTRAIIVLEVERVATSCGFGVPRMRFEGERAQLPAWAEHKGESGLIAYRAEKNRVSLDGLPGL